MRRKFEETKREALSMDKSHKQSWDLPIVPLLNLLNERPDTYSISSCSGRIVLMEYIIPEKEEREERKYDAKFMFSSHEEVKFEEIFGSVDSLPFSPDRTIWFQQEPVILHVRFFELNEDVKEILKIFRLIGFKKSGIFGFEPGKILLEVVGLEIMKMIIMKNGKLLPSKEYFRIMVEEGNKRVMRGHLKIQSSVRMIREYFINKRIRIINEFWYGEELKYVFDSKLRKKLVKKMKKPKFRKPLFKSEEERERKVKLWKDSISNLTNDELSDDSTLRTISSNEKFIELYNHLFHILDFIDTTNWFKSPNNLISLLISLHLYSFFDPGQDRNDDEEEVEGEEEEEDEKNEKRVSVSKRRVFKELEEKILSKVLEEENYKELVPAEKLVCCCVLKKSSVMERKEKAKKLLQKILDEEKSIFEPDKMNIYGVFL